MTPDSSDPRTSTAWTLPFSAVQKDSLPLVGGKGANLGEMFRQGWPVPPGFCVTTHAFRLWLSQMEGHEQDALFGSLQRLDCADTEALREAGASIRQKLLALPFPKTIEEAVVAAWHEQGQEKAYAVRSSATAEDLPNASFAGQQDTYLNIRGQEALLTAVRACWASLFTDRAIAYRTEQGFDHRAVSLAVVVQAMIFPEVSGILFTADPISQDRRLLSIDAGFGLGEALVSGIVSADLFQVDKPTRKIKTRKIAEKHVAIRPKPEGGTFEEILDPQIANSPSLRDDQILALADIGTRIESHYGQPQDIEWCIQQDQVFVVQSRPITSLYPLLSPQPDDPQTHAYMCFGHPQMMTDAIRPLGQSVLRWILPFGSAKIAPDGSPFLVSAGGRLYLDLTPLLNHPRLRTRFPKLIFLADERMSASLEAFVERPEFLEQTRSGHKIALSRPLRIIGPAFLRALSLLLWSNTRNLVPTKTNELHQLIADVQRDLSSFAQGPARFGRMLEILRSIFRTHLARKFLPLMMGGILSQRLVATLCKKDAHDPDIIDLTRGYEGNVTTEMDLHVADLAEVARRFPAVSEKIQKEPKASVLSTLKQVEGGEAFCEALTDFLRNYGMRGACEIDITRPRWSDDPSPLLQTIAGNLKSEAAGQHRQRHHRLIQEAEEAGKRLIAHARQMSGGWWRGPLVKRWVRVHRDLMGIREHPKFCLIRLMGLLRELLSQEAKALHHSGWLDDPKDIDFLTLEDIQEIVQQHAQHPSQPALPSTPPADWKKIIQQRKAEHERFTQLSPPRILTQHGEIVIAELRRENLPAGALVGSRASAGIVEGIARVILDPSESSLHHGEILVAPFTDPGWTPLFIHAAGLVMEVGGLMTHGSVVAREYGIPAVVSVPNATKLIKTGQRVRVNGDLGYVEILEEIP